jgi:D-3-phosphoglycerate dehydrogenase
MGCLLSALCVGGYSTITLRARGPRAAKLMPTLLRLAAVELLKPHLSNPVNVINVEKLAAQRGIELVQIHEPSPPQGLVGDIVSVRAEAPARGDKGADKGGDKGGESHRIIGTVYADGFPRVLRIDGWALDMIPEASMTLVINKDQPGVIGTVGSAFGDAGVNIADMAITRGDVASDGTAKALMVVKTDSAPPASLLEALRNKSNILRVKSITLPARTSG